MQDTHHGRNWKIDGHRSCVETFPEPVLENTSFEALSRHKNDLDYPFNSRVKGWILNRDILNEERKL